MNKTKTKTMTGKIRYKISPLVSTLFYLFYLFFPEFVCIIWKILEISSKRFKASLCLHTRFFCNSIAFNEDILCKHFTDKLTQQCSFSAHMAIKKLSLSLCPYAMCIGHLLKVECVCKAFCTSFVVQEGLESLLLYTR